MLSDIKILKSLSPQNNALKLQGDPSPLDFQTPNWQRKITISP